MTRRMVIGVLVVAITAAIVASAGGDSGATSIVGRWGGSLHPMSGSHAPSSQRFLVRVARGERSGTFQVGARCSGTLRLKDISDGFHHYTRVFDGAPCAPGGVDCLERDGGRMLDEFVAVGGTKNAVGKLNRD